MSTMTTAHNVRRIAVESITDPRTVNRFLRGEACRSMVAARIKDAMERLGIQAPPAVPSAALVTVPTLDGVPIPGARVRLIDGAREIVVEQTDANDHHGAFTTVRGEVPMVITYRIETDTSDDRLAVNVWLAALRVVMRSPPPAIRRLADPALDHLGVNDVVAHKIGGWYRPKETSDVWAVDVSFKEWKKSVKIWTPLDVLEEAAARAAETIGLTAPAEVGS